MKLITCGSCGFIGGEEELKSYPVSLSVYKLPPVPEGHVCASGEAVPTEEIKSAFEDMPAIVANLDLQYDGCPKCEAQTIFYKEILSSSIVFNNPGYGLSTSGGDQPVFIPTVWPADDSLDTTLTGSSHPDVVEQSTTAPDTVKVTVRPNLRPKESTTIKAVCDVCKETFDSSNHGSGSLGGKCSKCTNQLMG